MWERTVRFWAEEEPATPLALFRIALGAVLFVDLLGFWVADVMPLFLQDPVGLHRGGVDHWLITEASPELVWAVWGVSTLGAALLALGLGGRVTAFVTLQALMVFFACNRASGGGHDRLVQNALWLFVLGPSTHTLSMDCWLRTRRWVDDTPVPLWTRKLAVAQLVVMYTVTGLHKHGVSWFPSGGYSAVYDSLLVASWRRFDLLWLGTVYPLLQAATAVSWWWESTFAMVLVRWRGRDLRWLYVAIGVILHGVLAVASNLGPFSAITLSYYACLFRHDELVGILRLRRPAEIATLKS